MPTPYTVYTFTYTATDDLAFKLTTQPFWCREANIHVVTNDAKYGDLNTQDATIQTTDIASFQDFDLNDLYFKNATAGQNTTIYCVTIKMTDGRMAELGIPQGVYG